MGYQSILKSKGPKLDIIVDKSEYNDFILDTSDDLDIILDNSEYYEMYIDKSEFLDLVVDYSSIIDVELDLTLDYDDRLIKNEIIIYTTEIINRDVSICLYSLTSENEFILLTEDGDCIQYEN